MKTLPLDASDADVLEVVREWVGLLAEERYRDACDFLFQEGDDPHAWTPELIETLITNYGSLYSYDENMAFKITPLNDTQGEPGYDIERFEEGRPEGYVLFDLPLNGHWSDLTAIFDLSVINSELVLELSSIEVM